MPTDLETCANCDRTIGRLETAHLWKEQTVCAQCHKSLSTGNMTDDLAEGGIEQEFNRPETPEESARATAQEEAQKLTSSGKYAAVMAPGAMICSNPNCSFRGLPERRPRGSVLVMLVLLLIAVLPGLIYAIFMSGYVYVCPICGIALRTEHR